MAKSPEKPVQKLVCENRKARHRYELLDKVEAGLMLTGSEVKACRLGRANLSDSYAKASRGELFLLNCHIGPYPAAGPFQHEPLRSRKLLLHRLQLDRLEGKLSEKGLTLVPLRIYFNARGRAKVELALARGKKTHDRRQEIAERESRRQMDRARKRSPKRFSGD